MPVFHGKLDPISNREDWNFVIELDDSDTGLPLDLTGAQISVTIRDARYRSTVLNGSSNDGTVTFLDVGVFQITYLAAKMQNLRPDMYEVGVALVQNGVTVQLIIGLLPVLDGIFCQ